MHLSPDLIEAVVDGRLTEAEAVQVRSHAAECQQCCARLSTEEQTRRRLEVLATDAPEVNVVQQVLGRIAAEEQNVAGAGTTETKQDIASPPPAGKL